MILSEIEPGTKLELQVYNEVDEKINIMFISELEWISETKKDVAFIAAPIHEGTIYPVRVSSNMNVYFIIKTKLFTFKAKVLDRAIKDNLALLQIEVTSEFMRIQRRDFFRFDWNMPIKYRIIKYLNTEFDIVTPMIKTTTTDISGGGLCMIVEEEIKIGDYVECELILSDTRTITFYGQVARALRYAEDNQYKYSTGVLFKKIQDKYREWIINYIFRQQRNLRKKGLI